jgi:DNA-binding response OmpR family regulator
MRANAESGSSKTIKGALPLLIIEDEPSVMAFLKSALERNGYATVCANSAKAGLELLSAQQFGGIISDMRTPGGVTGADVHKWLTIHRPDLAQKLLFITGDTVNQETLTLLKKTGAPCIEKPFRVSQLLATLTHLLGSNS